MSHPEKRHGLMTPKEALELLEQGRAQDAHPYVPEDHDKEGSGEIGGDQSPKNSLLGIVFGFLN